jgi:hypothetical protein
MGILSEYMERLFEKTKRHPIYLVNKRINFQATKSARDTTATCETFESTSLAS